MSTTKKQTAVRFRPDTKKLIELLANDTGLTQTGVLELAVRDLAKQRKIALPDTREVYVQVEQTTSDSGADSEEEWEADMRALSEGSEALPVLPEEAFSRESIYGARG
jgi:hypothetical protein